ncbi:MAG: transposase [Patescibacteria group bacterium]|nr:transposase [Patescibacteria group bacterium]MDD5294309.1 transposase [Patescibacteria group bacterium]MDD5554132.1 transposase [Patescibacteria group bacterium]
MSKGRVIGIRHRVKKSTEGEPLPTQVAISENGDINVAKLPDEDAELDFVKNGLQAGDKVAMVLGGSGDRLAFALSRQGEGIGAAVFRVPPFVLNKRRKREREEDAITLAELFLAEPGLFYEAKPRDRHLILLRLALDARTEAMKARIACEQRLRQGLIGQIFCNPKGLYPEGKLEQIFDDQKASDVILQALAAEEKKREAELIRVVKSFDVFQIIFQPVEGCGPRIAAGIIAAVQDIRRFATSAQLKKFFGVHVMDDGSFVRRRHGQVASWNPAARQALFLLGDQFAKWRPNSLWGKKFQENKAKLRAAHPQVLCKQCGKPKPECKIKSHTSIYSDGHIHKMATWRTLSQFVVWLHRQWWKLEEAEVVKS